MILQGNVPLQRAVCNARELSFPLSVELVVDDVFPVKVDLKVVSFAGHDHLVPFPWLLRHVLGRANRTNDPAVVMVSHLRVWFAE